MVDANNMQKRMDEIQKSEGFADLFSKLVSGKKGYKTVIDNNKPVLKCTGCQRVMDGSEKFCPECGTKFEKK